eukprot:CAMPEP_0172161832 /NCGR_PEP_ID=MMETSP1050-20130122/6336_1 /TAXON_ID=233186 /ORGANISM="Cryptomonas curvata, Strain CCAP979/52" /LENGTH=106 /DNA_ID=CAMNT_0012831757 /DNA_START=111 /DNA_END=428 /DNA_ORIENTATION=-
MRARVSRQSFWKSVMAKNDLGSSTPKSILPIESKETFSTESEHCSHWSRRLLNRVPAKTSSSLSNLFWALMASVSIQAPPATAANPSTAVASTAVRPDQCDCAQLK